ncbi:phosphoglycerate mutase domain-containing protein [Tieghemostelium lacteum]|uniref:phosphoglycerate mutase (2,3-diphosphoglycerate-dependent) n=1 Tax=Tieghemostelium lacteum TaxID=361077 RepID=A0A151ZFL5_TIELA|nr:phosphoglycerate mutase domain-containing protein [Tieghemostelium lacteum]|eukprot:KYQ92772.1 phosphoglycerate mutase domain-containing protein [Tieghemostelium lacteum]
MEDSTNNNSTNNNGNIKLTESNNRSILLESLPEEKKTEKRLLDVDEEEEDTIVEEEEEEDVKKLRKLGGDDENDETIMIPTHKTNPPPKLGTSPISTSIPSTTSTTTTTTTTSTNSGTKILSPLQSSTFPPPEPSPKLYHKNISSHENFYQEEEYFDGRKIIYTATDSSDLSGGEEVSGSFDLTTSGNQINTNIGSNLVSSGGRRKKRQKLRKREGRIYELLEQRLGSEALKNNILGPTTTITFDWPYELVLVRHGQSEGNEAQARSKKGDLSAYTPEFKEKHSSVYRLTDKGILQAKIAGKWVKENIAEVFDRYYTSEYVRAMETASLLGLPEAKWLTEIQLRERDKGKMDNISWTEKNEKFAHDLELRKRDSFFWAPPSGESIADICQRVEHTFATLRRECANKRVIIVCHGEIMWAFRVRLERLSQIRFHQLQSSKDPRDQIHNTTILWYSRVHPKTGEINPYFRYLRMVCPWKPEYSAPGWLEFERPVYTNEELMTSVRSVPRFVNNTEKELSQPPLSTTNPNQPNI